MKLERLLNNKSTEILREAANILETTHFGHYDSIGKETYRIYLKNLFTLTLESIKSQSLLAINEYAENIAKDRYDAGFDLYEVLCAFHVLEQTIWMTIINDLTPEEYEEALRLTSTILGAGKEALAYTYVSLARKKRKPPRNIDALFKGTDGV